MAKTKLLAQLLFSETVNRIREKSIVLIGEIHGTKEIPMLLECYFDKLTNVYNFDMGLEIPLENQENIDSFFNSGDESYLRNMQFFRSANSDGRNSLEYMHLIKQIYGLNKEKSKQIRIFCVDVDPNDLVNQRERELKIAENILHKLRSSTGKKLFVVLGNVHASKSAINLGKEEVCTAAYLIAQELGESAYSIDIKPLAGEFYNFGVKKIEELENDDWRVFNHVFCIDEVNPCSFLLDAL